MTTCLCGNEATTTLTLGWNVDKGDYETTPVCVGCKREMETEREWSRSR